MVFLGEGRFVRGRYSLPLHLCQSFEIVVATVEAESALMVLQLVGSVEIERAVEASVLRESIICKHKVIFQTLKLFCRK